MDVRLKRAYDPATPTDGYRVLVDRLWPRGVSRERARLDAWEKDLAPSPKLRQWFGHAPERFDEFRRRYVDELRGRRRELAALRRRAREGTLTLVYSAHDREHNDAVVLAEILRRGLPCRETLNAPQTYDAGVAHQIGRYADAIRVPAGYDQIVVSGTAGLDEKGKIPADFDDEARQEWRSLAAILEKAGASISDIVSIRQYLTREEDVETYFAVQKEMLTHEPAGMLLVPTAMVWPEIHVEVEAVALVPSGR